jgi:type I restriction enzyme S subunit
MGSNYKPIGDYIELIDERNKGLKVTNLVGLSISKQFIKSVANTIGTDMENYKIIRQNQFACSTMQVRRDKKMPLALYTEIEPAIISQAYPVFEIVDSSVLSAEYLMMWFTRSEFDRQACFHAVGGVRGSLEWEDFLDMELPIPSIEKQREIVKEYNTVVNRIQLNEQLSQKLEETAQAIYKQWFVDFEFPWPQTEALERQGLGHLAGKPYKSSGGKMVWNEELEKEIPEGWRYSKFTDVIKISGGGTPSTNIAEYWGEPIPFYTPGDRINNYYSIKTAKSISELGLQKCSSKLYPVNTIFITARGATVGGISMAGVPMAMNQTCYALSGNGVNNYYAHQLTIDLIDQLKTEAIGATFGALVTKDFEQKSIITSELCIIDAFGEKVSAIYYSSLILTKETMTLKDLAETFLAKMTKVKETTVKEMKIS